MVKHATVQPRAAEAKGCLSLQMKTKIYNLTGCNQILLFLLLCPLQTVLVQGLTALACSGTGLRRFTWDLAGRGVGEVGGGTCFQQAFAIGEPVWVKALAPCSSVLSCSHFWPRLFTSKLFSSVYYSGGILAPGSCDSQKKIVFLIHRNEKKKMLDSYNSIFSSSFFFSQCACTPSTWNFIYDSSPSVWLSDILVPEEEILKGFLRKNVQTNNEGEDSWGENVLLYALSLLFTGLNWLVDIKQAVSKPFWFP